MIDLLASLFWFCLVWTLCRLWTRCHVACLNRQFHLRLGNRVMRSLLLYQQGDAPKWALPWEETRELMGIDGILGYLVLMPATLFVWARDGYIFLTKGEPFWYDCLFLGMVIFCTADYWLGYFLLWRRWKQEERKKQEQ